MFRLYNKSNNDSCILSNALSLLFFFLLFLFYFYIAIRKGS